MDARGRGRAGDVDPADQWVFNPDTGSYELRQHAPRPPRQRQSPEPYAESYAPPADPYAPPAEPRLPGQRRRPVEDPGARPSRRKPKPPKTRKQKALLWGGGTMAFLLLGGCVGAYVLYEQLNGNINTYDIGEENAATTDGPVNILILGTDARTGKGNEGYGDAGSVGHADTTLLLHVAEDRKSATALSIPRDMIVDIPNCTSRKDGEEKSIPATPNQRFNTSLGQSGRDPSCTIDTTEKLTGLNISHFMMADFNAVKELSSAVGGVEVCTTKPINDPKSHLKLPKGKSVVEGEDALAFVRTRHSVGFGSDLSRIELQQQFLGSLVRKMKSGGTLTNPKKLYDLSQVATKALTVDTGIGSVKKLMQLANDLKQVPQKNIEFATVPVVDNPDDPATVVLDKTKAEPLFKMLQADRPLNGGAKGKKEAKKVKKAPAAEVRVDVYNGSGVTGQAQNVLTWLQTDKGVPLSTNAGDAGTQNQAKTTLTYAPNQADQAATLADMMGLPKSAMKQTKTDAGAREAMKLSLGKDFTGVGTPIEAPDKAPEGVQHVNADDKNICAK
ncbi:LCP family protein [Streptomyces sp. A7024]|uniref:LCP family protein n=1 Tax=Streptomyces coryli TaxID=1128680 RepID=A0A6G4U102_9ACTN|nr:LCP family protein [Streptomyces coryli]